MSSREILSRGKAIIFVEKNCPACDVYLKNLQACTPAVQDRLTWVSTDTASVAKKEFRRTAQVPFVIRDRRQWNHLRGTPTTLIGAEVVLGLMSCGDLHKKIEGGRHGKL